MIPVWDKSERALITFQYIARKGDMTEEHVIN